MHDHLCDYIKSELDELDRKVKNGGKLTASELEYGDMLAHFWKSMLTACAMEESDGYSNRYDGRMYRGRSYGDGYGGMSNAGRRNVQRDSMGRYSGDGYSYHDSMHDLLEDMRGMMGDLPEDKRRKAERLIDELSR